MRLLKPLVLALFGLLASVGLAQIPNPQINLSGNIGCQGFPCLNNGTLIMASDANRTMTALETSAMFIKVTSSVSLTATRNLIAPAGRFNFTIENATTGGQSIQIIGASGTGITIGNGTTVAVWNDGTNFIQIGSAGGGGTPGGSNHSMQYNSGGNFAGALFNGIPKLSTTADPAVISPTLCSSGLLPNGIDVNGNSANCLSVPAVLGYTPAQAANLIASPIVRYDMIHVSGTTLTDSSGNGNNGTLVGSTLPVANSTNLFFAAPSAVSVPSAANAARTWYITTFVTPTLGQTIVQVPAFQALLTSSLGGGVGINILTRGLNLGYSDYNSTFQTACYALTTGYVTYAFTLGTNSSTDPDHFYINGQECGTYQLQGAQSGAQSSGNLFIGGAPSGAFASASNVGQFYWAEAFAGEHTAAQVLTESTNLNNIVGARGVQTGPEPLNLGLPQITGGIDSITAGSGSTSGTDGWMSYLTLTNQPSYNIVNFGIPSDTLIRALEDAPYRDVPQCTSVQGPNIWVVFGGTNDLGGSSPASVFGNLTNYVQKLKNAGCRVYIGTMIDRTGTGFSGISYSTLKNTYDQLILTGWQTTGADGVIDFADILCLGADGTAGLNSCWANGVHPNDTGYPLMGAAASNKLNYDFGFNDLNPHILAATGAYTMAAGDGTLNIASASATTPLTMPSCIGQTGSVYHINNQQAVNTVTVVGSLSSEPINGSTSAVAIPSNTSLYLIDTRDSTAVAGCYWMASPTGTGGGSGTVTSVGLTMPGVLFNASVPGSPVTSSGTLAPTLITQLANVGLFGPASGSAATPTFRAIVPADLPLGSSSAFGAFKVDGTTITASAGVLSAVTGGGGTVTHSAGALTALNCVIGNGSADIKVDPNCSTDGAGNMSAASYTATGTTPGSSSLGAGTGSIPALLANSAGFAAPVTGGTSYLFKLPATISQGIAHFGGPATMDGVTESAITSSAINLASGDVSGNLPNANLATQTANTLLGALTATTPSGLPVPSCSGASNALNWVSGTGFSCNSSISASQANITTNIAGTTNFATFYQSGPNATAPLSPNTTAVKEFYSMTGTGSAGAAPVWGALASADIPNNAANTTGTAAGLTSYPTLCSGGQFSQGLSSGSNNCGTPSGSGTIFQQNGVGLTSSTTVNFQSGSGITVSNPSAGNVAFNLGIVPVANGGTGASSFTAHTFLGNNTGSTAAPSQALIGASDWGPNSYIAGAGSVNVMTATLNPAATALTTGLQAWVLPNLANTTTTPTLNLNSLGAVTITKSVAGVISALAANDYVTTLAAHVFYDGTEWVLLNPQSSSGGGSTSLSAITAAAGSNTIANGNNPQTWNWAPTTASQVSMTYGETTAATGAGDIGMLVQTLAGSTATPFVVRSSLTGTQALIGMQDQCTWNVGSTVTGPCFQIKIVNTASNSASLAFDVNDGSSEFSIARNGVVASNSAATFGGAVKGSAFNTLTNCTANGTSASPSVVTCSGAPMGAFTCAVAASGATCTVNTTAVNANSEVRVEEVAYAGTRLGVTCNTSPTSVPVFPVASITAGTGFTINVPVIVTNPACYIYTIFN